MASSCSLLRLLSQINPEIPQLATGVDASPLELSSEGYEGLGSIFQGEPFFIPVGEMSPNEPETLHSATRQLPGDCSLPRLTVAFTPARALCIYCTVWHLV